MRKKVIKTVRDGDLLKKMLRTNGSVRVSKYEIRKTIKEIIAKHKC